MDELKVLFGKRLKELRISSNLTQEKLAGKANVSPDFISLIERGQRSPSFETIEKFASILKVRIYELFKFSNQ